jgi:hypothetical protein
MKRFVLAFLLLTGPAFGQDTLDIVTVQSNADWILRGSRPKDYEAGAIPNAGAVRGEVLFLKAKPGVDTSPRLMGTMMRMTPSDPWPPGKRIRLSARLKTENAGTAVLWLRIDQRGSKASAAFYNMLDRPIRSTTDWTLRQIVLEVPQNSFRVAYGFFLGGGRGQMMVDDLKLEEVGTDVPLSISQPCCEWDGSWTLPRP